MNNNRLVTIRLEGDIAIVSLNRPERHNALVPALLSQLLQVLDHPDCQTASAIILRAEGQSFSTGGDLSGFQHHKAAIGGYAWNLVGQLNQVILAMYTHPAPIACAVHGQVTGGSLGLLLAADHIIMKRGVTITPFYSVVGFSPDGGWTAILPDIIGRKKTMNWLTDNTGIDADTCLTLGLAQELVEDDCDASAIAWAKMVADKTKHNRKLTNTCSEVIRQRLETERENFTNQVQTRYALDGIDQFLRRKEHV